MANEHRMTITCNFCKTHVEATVNGIVGLDYYDGYALLKCGNCGHANMVAFHSEIKRLESLFRDRIGNISDHVSIRKQWPESDIKIPRNLPEKVETVYKQAEKAYEVGIWESALERYRKAIEQACKDKGQTSGNIVSKINALHTNGQITKDLNDWAHEIRIIGNEAAHDDPLPDNKAKKEATDIRLFCELFMTYVYTLPKKLAERRGDKIENENTEG